MIEVLEVPDSKARQHIMIYVLDSDNQWWRASNWGWLNDNLRMDDPQWFTGGGPGFGRSWRPYEPGGLIFPGEAKEVNFPIRSIKRYVIQ